FNVCSSDLEEPSDELIRLLAGRIYEGRFTASARDEFAPIVKSALNEFIRERVSDRLKSALKVEDVPSSDAPAVSAAQPANDDGADGDSIETTVEEMEAFAIIKSILRREVDASRIVLRDAKSYAAILLDNNNRKPICRLWFNAKSK